jgi:hypothetical protein
VLKDLVMQAVLARDRQLVTQLGLQMVNGLGVALHESSDKWAFHSHAATCVRGLLSKVLCVLLLRHA